MRIPNDLVDWVVRHVDDKFDLHHLLFVSPTFQRAAHRMVLATIDMGYYLDDPRRPEALKKHEALKKRFNQMFEFISQTDNLPLARAVRRLVYQPYIISDALLDVVIPQMVNLIDLTFGTHLSLNPIHRSFYRCPCKLLYLTTLHHHSEITPLIDFVKTQPGILEMSLRSTMQSPAVELLENDGRGEKGGYLMNLTTLYCGHNPSRSLSRFLTNRPRVRRLQLRELSALENQDMRGFRHVRALACCDLGDGPQPVFENVEFLAFSGMTQYELIERSYRFPALRYLSLEIYSFATVPASVQATLYAIFKKFSNLETVAVMIDLFETMFVFNRELEQIGTKPYDGDQWRTYPLQD